MNRHGRLCRIVLAIAMLSYCGISSGKPPANTNTSGNETGTSLDITGGSGREGGDSVGANLRSANYTANALNQYTSREVPGYLNVIGAAHANAAVTVNGSSPYRKGEYFRNELTADNASAAQWQAITNIASLTGTNQTNTGNLFLPKTAEIYTYDADGNLTSDGRWTNRWDGENRLIDMTSHASGPSGSRKSLQFAYDSQGRRCNKVVSNWTGSAWSKVLDERFIYDGWNLVAALNASNATVIRSFLWGLDLTGSLQGAAGVGGLIAFRQHSGSQTGAHFAAFDGNGNVMALVDSGGTLSARYEYEPFGQTVRASGTAATINPVRFSSKCVDEESDLVHYIHRYLNANTGRWLSRDPIGHKGGKNLYGFALNDPLSKYDLLGQITVRAVGGFNKGDCGAFDIRWSINLDNAAQSDGYIVQHIKFRYNATTCSGTALQDSFEYWEAIPITAGQLFAVENGAPSNDFWNYPASPGTRGTLQMTGDIKFFPSSLTGPLGNFNEDSPAPVSPPWTAGGSYGGSGSGFGLAGTDGPPFSIDSGSYPSTGTEPGFWNQPAIEQFGGLHLVNRRWICCCPEVDPNEGLAFP